MRPSRRAIALSIACFLASAPPARADVELWNQFITDVQLRDAGVLPHSLNFTTDVRYNSQLVGLERVQLRWGPRWDLVGPLTLGLNHVAYLQQPQAGTYVQEQRLELEPRLGGEIGPVAWRDRNRLEWRWRPDRQRWRYRNQLQFEVPVQPGWAIFVSDEAFWELEAPAFAENRVTVGWSREVAGAGWELAYTYRTRYGANAPAGPDHLITLAWFNAVKRAPLLAGVLD